MESMVGYHNLHCGNCNHSWSIHCNKKKKSEDLINYFRVGSDDPAFLF